MLGARSSDQALTACLLSEKICRGRMIRAGRPRRAAALAAGALVAAAAARTGLRRELAVGLVVLAGLHVFRGRQYIGVLERRNVALGREPFLSDLQRVGDLVDERIGRALARCL